MRVCGGKITVAFGKRIRIPLVLLLLNLKYYFGVIAYAVLG